jgi:hypothetical protein
MPRPPLDPDAGVMTTIVAARVPDADADALVALARARGLRRPELIREILRHAIAKWAAEAELEGDTGPPVEGG